MDTVEKLKHEFSNSIVIIKRMSKTASSFSEKIYRENLNNDSINHRQAQLFRMSMQAIQLEAEKIEKIFVELLKTRESINKSMSSE